MRVAVSFLFLSRISEASQTPGLELSCAGADGTCAKVAADSMVQKLVSRHTESAESESEAAGGEGGEENAHGEEEAVDEYMYKFSCVVMRAFSRIENWASVQIY